MLDMVYVYEKEYTPNKIYWDKAHLSFALMSLGDGSYVVGKGTGLLARHSSKVWKADDEVEPVRARFLDGANRLKSTLRFAAFADLQRFFRGRKEYIHEEAVLIDLPNKIYVGSNKFGTVFCSVNAESPDESVSVKVFDSIYSKDLTKIPIIDKWVESRLSLKEFNELYKEYEGGTVYFAEESSKRANIDDAVTTLSVTFPDEGLQRLLKVRERTIDEMIQVCRATPFRDIGFSILNGKFEPSEFTEDGFIYKYCGRSMMFDSNLQQLIMLYGIKQNLDKQKEYRRPDEKF